MAEEECHPAGARSVSKPNRLRPANSCRNRQEFSVRAARMMMQELDLVTLAVPPMRHRGKAWGLALTHRSGWKTASVRALLHVSKRHADLAIIDIPAILSHARASSKRVKTPHSSFMKRPSRTTSTLSPRKRVTVPSRRQWMSGCGTSAPLLMFPERSRLIPSQDERITYPAQPLFTALPQDAPPCPPTES